MAQQYVWCEIGKHGRVKTTTPIELGPDKKVKWNGYDSVCGEWEYHWDDEKQIGLMLIEFAASGKEGQTNAARGSRRQ